MKRLKKFLLVLVFSLVGFSLVFSENFYMITESELIMLEVNNEKLKNEIEILKTQQAELKALQNQMMKYCEQLEKEKKIMKAVAIGGSILSICSGFFIGFYARKD